MNTFRVLCVIAALSLSGCLVNRTRSTIDDNRTAYSMTRDQARDIVKSSIAAFISPDYVNQTAADSLTASGYIRAGIDTQTINVTAIPATGGDAADRSRSGYGFLLNDRGTIGLRSYARRNLEICPEPGEPSGRTVSRGKRGITADLNASSRRSFVSANTAMLPYYISTTAIRPVTPIENVALKRWALFTVE
jgi:hypothetical protein